MPGPAEESGIGAPQVLVRLCRYHWRNKMTTGTILLIIVVLLLIGAIPAWPYSGSWGYGPSGGLGLVLVLVIILLLLGKI